MRCHYDQLRISASRQAFTLVEMLVVCAVILILVTLTLFAVHKVAVSSKTTKTRATIQKLDVALQPIFETREDKFLALKHKVAHEHPDLDKESQLRIAIHYLRDTMRMEMPQCWEEVSVGPTTMTLNNTNYCIEESPLLNYYRQAKPDGITPSRSALLFLIIQNLNPEALEAFHGSEVADTNGDGLLEFVDAWGRPIRFLRWAPALTDSDLQPNVLALCNPKYVPQHNVEDNRNWWTARDGRLKMAMEAATEQHPFLLEGQGNMIGWFLYPLIYSAGPNGVYGIDDGNDEWQTEDEIDPYASPAGMPNGSSHFDNIHNHQWYRSF